MKFSRKAMYASALVALLYVTQPGIMYSCGPFAPTAVFSYGYTPDLPLDRYARGELGVIHPGLRTSYLFVAYRYLTDEPLNNAERNALNEYWKGRLGDDRPEERALARWVKVRARVVPVKKEVSPYRELGAYYYFPNCLADAFDNAARTLNLRIATFGVANPFVKDWVGAQDTVFANCRSGKTIPAPASPAAPPVIRADRAYQVAAAHFYSADFTSAEAAFQAIIADTASPWSGIARYLQARVLVRRAMLDDDGTAGGSTGPAAINREVGLERAAAMLRAIVADPALRRYHRMARERLGMIEARLRPQERLRHLAAMLSRPRRSDLLDQEVSDLFYLIDRNPTGSTDLVDWIQTMRDLRPDSPDRNAAAVHALQRWLQRKSLPWLVAVTSIPGGQLSDPVLDAAKQVPPDSPARFTMALALTRSGRVADGPFIDAFLNAPAPLSYSTANHLLQARFRRARDFSEFRRALPRHVAATVWYAEDENLFNRHGPLVESVGPKIPRKSLFDHDGARALNRRLPLEFLVTIPGDTSLPSEIRRDLAVAAWTKAVLLERAHLAERLAPVLTELAPELTPYLAAYAKEQDPVRKRFSAYFAILNFPGMSPLVTSDYGRQAKFDRIENYRHNWWCGKSKPGYEGSRQEMPEDPGEMYADEPLPLPPPLAFLSPAQQETAETEWKQLSALETAPNLIAKAVLAYREQHPSDPRVPDALDLSLRALRYGCSDATYRDLSQRVFRVLHTKYPHSRAAKRNRPWG